MTRSLLKSALVVAALAPLFAHAAHAGEQTAWNNALTYGQVRNGVPIDGTYNGYNYTNNYPPVQASLYPSPKPDIPYEVGRTIITNPALAPHEMLYVHQYRALYPPYYYKNKCGLSCLPFVPKHPLCGTEVTVKYKSHMGLFSSFYPPISRVAYSNSSWK